MKKTLKALLFIVVSLALFSSLVMPTGLARAATAVPGTIQAEDYDGGGEGVAYHDTDTTNSKGQYRTDAVDIETSTDTGGGYNIADIQPTEWLRYTVNVGVAGPYELSVRVASLASGGSLRVEVDGVNVTGTMTVPVTGGWQTWSTITKTGINLTAGQHTVKLIFDSAGFNVNWIKFTTNAPTLTATRTPTATNTSSVPANTPTLTPTRTATNPPPAPTATAATGCGTTNIALNKSAASSTDESASYLPSLAVDGNAGTRWASAYSDPQWIRVDLGSVQNICRVKLNWEAAYAQSYQVQISNDASYWSAIYSTTSGNGATDDLTGLAGSARYVRIYGTVRGTGYGYSLWDFEVYGGINPGLNPHQVVNTYGRLQISGTSLRDKNGVAIQLVGMSSHGLTWYPLSDLNLNTTSNINILNQEIAFNPAGGVPFPYTSSAVGNLVTQWHMQVTRASMFTYDPWNGSDAKSYDNAYPNWKWYNINLVNSVVQSAIDQNIYVIIDWHAGEGGDPDPNIYWNNGHAQEFFNYMVDKWGSYPNVIYETVNSPVIGWSAGLKTYNQNVINLIRAREIANGYSPNVILVGTPTWSQDIDVATSSPLSGNLIAYNYMWYAGTHFGWVESRGNTALANLAANAPNQTIFMGEIGTSEASGAGGIYYGNFNTLMEWAKTKKLSWLNWSIANKEEASAVFVPAITGSANVASNEIAWRGGNGTIAQALASTGFPMRMGPWADADYSCSGKFIKAWMLYNMSQPTPGGC